MVFKTLISLFSISFLAFADHSTPNRSIVFDEYIPPPLAGGYGAGARLPAVGITSNRRFSYRAYCRPNDDAAQNATIEGTVRTFTSAINTVALQIDEDTHTRVSSLRLNYQAFMPTGVGVSDGYALRETENSLTRKSVSRQENKKLLVEVNRALALVPITQRARILMYVQLQTGARHTPKWNQLPVAEILVQIIRRDGRLRNFPIEDNPLRDLDLMEAASLSPEAENASQFNIVRRPRANPNNEDVGSAMEASVPLADITRATPNGIYSGHATIMARQDAQTAFLGGGTGVYQRVRWKIYVRDGRIVDSSVTLQEKVAPAYPLLLREQGTSPPLRRTKFWEINLQTETGCYAKKPTAAAGQQEEIGM